MRIRTDTLALYDAQAAAKQFTTDFHGHYQILEVTEQLVERAMVLAEKYGLRGYDSIQLSAALALKYARDSVALSEITFVCADDRLNKAATAEGLLIENPNTY